MTREIVIFPYESVHIFGKEVPYEEVLRRGAAYYDTMRAAFDTTTPGFPVRYFGPDFDPRMKMRPLKRARIVDARITVTDPEDVKSLGATETPFTAVCFPSPDGYHHYVVPDGTIQIGLGKPGGFL